TASPATDATGQVISGAYTPDAGVTGVRVRITVEAALTGGTVWWDDVELRKTATSVPQQWVSGLTAALSQLGDDISDALNWIKDLIEKLTGQARTSLEDALTDAATFATQLKTLLSGGSVLSPLPNLTSLVQLGQSQITGLVSDLGGKASTAAVDTLNTFVQNLVDAILRALRGVPVVGGTLADIISDLGGVKDTADTAQQQISTGVSGQVVTAGLLDVQQFTLTSFTTPGSATYIPPTPPSGYEIDYYLVTAYGAGQGGGRGEGAPGGRGGGRVVRRLSPAEMDASSKAVVVGAPGIGKSSSDGLGSGGGVSSFGGTLVQSSPGSSSIPTQYGPLPSSAAPGDGGRAGFQFLTGVTANQPSHFHTIASPGSSTSTGSADPIITVTSTSGFYPGDYGESSETAAGGQPGIAGGSFWIPGGQAATAGQDGTTKDWYTTGGAGGGGGCPSGSATAQAGANGGAPGGGGGAGVTNGGDGGRGQVDILAVYKPSAA
ncbi:hypothetical protein ACPXB3_22335, partial [Gordonia sp. DT219]